MKCTDPRHKHSTPERAAACAQKTFKQQRRKSPPRQVERATPREVMRGQIRMFVWSEGSSTRY